MDHRAKFGRRRPLHLLLICLLLLGMAILTGCNESNPKDSSTLEPADLLPASGEISGWDKESGGYGEADDYSSLWDLIDGAADQYIDYGFVEAVQQFYNGTIGGEDATLELFISDQGSAGNAAALFDDELVVPPNLTAWDEAGDEAGIDEVPLFQVSIYLRQDRFFVRVTVDKKNDDVAALNTAKAFALAVVDGIN